MSLILEALKKSEAKRRLGEAPDLGTPFTAPKRRSNLLPLLLVAIVAAGGFGWWFLRQPAANVKATADKVAPKTLSAVTNSPATLATARVQPAAQAQVQTPPAMHPQAATQPPQRQQPAPSADPIGGSSFVAGRPSPQSGGSVMPAAKLPPNMHRVQHETQPATNPAASGAPNVAAVQPAIQESADARNAATAKASSTAAPATVPKTADMKGAAPAAGAPVLAKAAKTPDMRGLTPPGDATKPVNAAANTPEVRSDTPFYYELPFNVRKSLPALRLSMHVYAGDPKQRFVILNDSRLGEGDRTADDVTLREVRKDGAILEFQGQRFFYPRDSL